MDLSEIPRRGGSARCWVAAGWPWKTRPRTLGAILRTVVAAGAERRGDSERRGGGAFHRLVGRAAPALWEHNPRLAAGSNPGADLGWDLKERQTFGVYGLESEAAEALILNFDYSTGCVLVWGGEGGGLHRLVQEACANLAHIPLRGPMKPP